MQSGQWINSSDGQHWYFDPGSLALDFAYTGDFGTGHPQWEQWHTPHDLQDWVQPRFGDVGPATTDQLGQARALRDAICLLATARADHHAPPPAAIDLINQTAAARPVRPFLPGGTITMPPPELSQVLSTIAEDTIDLSNTPDGRVRRCAATDCQLIFVDLSRPNSRRWCSMSRCGNRSKLRRRRAPRLPTSPNATS